MIITNTKKDKIMTNTLMDLFMKRRNYTQDFLRSLNDAHHQKLLNIDKMSAILKQVHDHNDHLVIMPDFDADGIDAGIVGYSGLSQLGFYVDLYYPHPEQGYGIMPTDIDRVLKKWPDTKYIISCDVGITCYEAFRYAASKGIHILITDHHEEQKIKPEPLINDVIVNPCQLAETYSLRNICGAYVFWQILDNYAKQYAEDQVNMINAIRVFAGIGTIGDMMPLVHENRKLVQDTVKMLKFLYQIDTIQMQDFLGNANATYRQAFMGLKKLLDELDKARRIRTLDDVDEKLIGWTIVPMYNSVKRLGLQMSLVFGIFFNKDLASQSECATTLIAANDQRKTMVKQYMALIDVSQAQRRQPWAPFIYITDAPGGVLGLLANKLMRRTNLPTFVINSQTLSGSGRSKNYFPVITYLTGTEFHVAGHEEAFGIMFDDLNQINRFYDYLQKNVMPLAEKAAYQNRNQKNYDLLLGSGSAMGDENLNIDETMDFYQDVQNLRPFGVGLPEPKISIKFNSARIYTMGDQHQHLKLILPEHLQMIAWNQAQAKDRLEQGKMATFTGNLSINEFNGRKSLQLIGDLDN